MARMARAEAVGFPYHIAHCGNHRDKVFFTDAQRRRYLEDMAEGCKRYGLEIWAYCLMPNHVHFLAAPRLPGAMGATIRLAHGRHSRRVQKQKGWTGHLWANRYYSCCLDGPHLWKAIRYVELNPVRAGLVSRAEDYHWSSARAHSLGIEDSLLSPSRPFPGGVENWSKWLREGLTEEDMDQLRRHTRTGRPLGDIAFVNQLETLLKRVLHPLKRGPKPKGKEMLK